MIDDRDIDTCFNEVKDVICAIDKNKIAGMNMPLSAAMQEVRRVELIAETYYQKLATSGINPEYLDSISTRASAFAHCVASAMFFVNTDETAQEQYKRLKKEGYALRKNLIKIFRFVFRNDPAVMSALTIADQKHSDHRMTRDLFTLSKLGLDRKAALSAVNIDLSILSRAQSLHDELTAASAQCTLHPEEIAETKLLCRKAWTYVLEAIQEIFIAGRFVFDSEPNIKELFYFDCRQEYARSRTHRKST